jgi:hypothetical protein
MGATSGGILPAALDEARLAISLAPPVPEEPTMTAKKIGFSAVLIAGHKGVDAVIVPFDPEEVWGKKAILIDGRREGWLVAGSMNGVPFKGWIGHRWGRHFIIVDAATRAAARTSVGATIELMVAPTTSRAALAIAREQAPSTTAPGRKRAR